MKKEKLNELLDSIYELEGLVHLALAREDIPAHLLNLIKRKGYELSETASVVSVSCFAEKREISQKLPGEERCDAEEPAPVVKDGEEEEPPLYIVDGPFDEPEASDAELIDDDMQSVVEEVFSSVGADESVDDGAKNNPCPTGAEHPGEEIDLPEETEREPRGRLVFSINDRYRFKRELFGDSDADFNNTLALVASMESYDEAEDYFLGELQWDQKRGEVIEFLDVLKRYFK